MQHIFRTAPIIIILSFWWFASASTLPLAVGNQWVYAYHDSTWQSDSYIDTTYNEDSTRAGILTMTIQSLKYSNDTTFFSISYYDSGIINIFRHTISGSGTHRDTTNYSVYDTNYVQNYFAVNGAVFTAYSLGWHQEFSPKLYYYPQKDTIYPGGSPGTYQSFKTVPVMIHVGTDSLKGYKQYSSQHYYGSFPGGESFTWIEQDTASWADSFGLAVYMSMRFDTSAAMFGFYGTRMTHSQNSLLQFNKLTSRVKMQQAGTSTRHIRFSAPEGTARKIAVVKYPFNGNYHPRTFSLTGRQLTNRIGRQILLLAP